MSTPKRGGPTRKATPAARSSPPPRRRSRQTFEALPAHVRELIDVFAAELVTYAPGPIPSNWKSYLLKVLGSSGPMRRGGRPVQNAGRDAQIVGAFINFRIGKLRNTERRTRAKFLLDEAMRHAITPDRVSRIIDTSENRQWIADSLRRHRRLVAVEREAIDLPGTRR